MTDEGPNCCTRIGDNIIDLALLFSSFRGPLFSKLNENIFKGQRLNRFMELGPEYRKEAR